MKPTIFLVVLLAALPAHAAPPSLFERLDRDGDGALSDAERGVKLAQRVNWIAIDLDRDGRIERPEFRSL